MNSGILDRGWYTMSKIHHRERLNIGVLRGSLRDMCSMMHRFADVRSSILY